MRAAGRHFAALGVGAVILMSSGCGSSDGKEGDPLPRDAAAAISQRLTEVQRRYDDATTKSNRGACEDIERDSYKAISATVSGLPDGVDPDVRKALEESLSRLEELTREGCSQVEAPPRQETTPEETTPPPLPPQETTPEHTDTQETVPEKKKKPKPPKDDGNGTVTPPGGTGTQPGSDGGGQPAPQPEGD